MEVVAHLAERRDTPKTHENPIVTRQKPLDQIQIQIEIRSSSGYTGFAGTQKYIFVLLVDGCCGRANRLLAKFFP